MLVICKILRVFRNKKLLTIKAALVFSYAPSLQYDLLYRPDAVILFIFYRNNF